MNIIKVCATSLLASLGLSTFNGVQAAPCSVDETHATNKAISAMALDLWFNQRNASSVADDVVDPYLQHNPNVRDGHAPLKAFIGVLGNDSKYELSVQVAEDDLVWSYGRYTGIPDLPVSVVVDIFRAKDGKLVEHWDVMMADVPASQTASGRELFPIEE